MIKSLIPLLLALLIGIAIGWRIRPIPKPEIQVKTDTLITYINKTDTLVKPIFYTRKDTVFVTKLDTFYIENYYIAEVDTTYEDDLLHANIKYISDIPLSKDSYFDLKFKVKQKEVIKVITKEKEESFWHNRFVPYLGVGLSYTQDNKIYPSIQLGFGIRF
jgi:hypothetical protein